MNDLKLIFSKTSFLGNPAKLIKLVWQFESLTKKQRSTYPNSLVTEELYVKIGEEIYQLQNKKFIKGKFLPNEANLIIISKKALEHSLIIVEKPGDGDINQLLKGLHKEKGIEKYQEIIDEISESFLTNVSMKKLINIVRKQMF
ncbi:hypothetical protein [Lactococcus lactis]|uniref:Uncharacterized protein n=1 Tax=Lactococcus lactis subsp. lactis TaxID=1360 RepID=A0A2N5WFB0_LACLL|nr:hypothetical protein [Lactococcus lactis]PLW60934.1 hypothetical protein CYU10_001992 [Lactococcus lactis subsp. lactis]